MNLKRLVSLFFAVALLLCCGCSSAKKPYYKNVILMTEQDYQAVAVIDELKESGVKVSLSGGNGDNKKGNIKLLVAEKDVFNPNSANFNSKALAVFDRMVVLMNLYDEESVKVQGSSVLPDADKHIPCTKALSLARSQRVVRYLWSQDINASLAYADDKDSKELGYIEITFNP